MTREQALQMGFCKYCNLWQKIKSVEICVVGRLPALNWRNIPAGICALTEEEIQQRKKDGRIK